MKPLLRRIIRLFQGRDRGTVAITFLLSLPILMTILGVIVQYALLINAKLTINRALAAAARSAMTSLPTDPAIDQVNGMQNVTRTALIGLAPLSPVATSSSVEATEVTQALQTLGIAEPDSFAGRYTYAATAANISITPQNVNNAYVTTAAPYINISITYQFKLTMPFANLLIGRSDTIAGVTGHYFTLTSTLTNVQLSDGREVPTNANGDP